MFDHRTNTDNGAPALTRWHGNPLLSSRDIPYAEGLIYNGGVIKYEGRYVMLARVDHADLAAQCLKGVSDIALAFSNDGIRWEVQPKPCIAWRDDEIELPMDPRLMVVEGRCYVSLGVQTRHGMQGFVLVTEDFDRFDLVFKTTPDNRGIVLFPEKIGDCYLRIERPFPTFGHGKKAVFDMWTSESPDLIFWGRPEVLLDVDQVPYAGDRVGAGTPPLLTDRGWLLLFHAVTDDSARGKNGWEDQWTRRYTAGALLLDRDDPRRIVGLSPEPVLVPEAPYEVSGGYRNGVVFPSGWVLEDTGEVKIYYGAADTVQCLATAHIDDLVRLCRPLSEMG